MFWRYGLSIIREKILMKNNFEKFTKIYEALNSKVIFSDVRQLINHIGLEDLVTQSIKAFLLEKHVDEKYIDEFANLLLKIIYNQQNDINAFAGIITLICGSYESFRVEGGNYEIVKKLAEALLEKRFAEKKMSYAINDETEMFENQEFSGEEYKRRIFFDNEAKVEIKKNANVIRIVKKFYDDEGEIKGDMSDFDSKLSESRNIEDNEAEFKKANDFFYTLEFQKNVYDEENENSYNKSKSNNTEFKNINYIKINSTKINDNNEFNYNNNNNSNFTDQVFFEDYDIVILASPLEHSKIQFPSDIDLKNTNLLPKKNYYYFIKGKLKNSVFNDYEASELPGMLISYNKTLSKNILYIRQLNDNFHKDEFKVNSDEILTEKDLLEYFEPNYKIKYINHWEMAYPKLTPRKLETLPSFQLAENLFYLNAIESVASCMELSMISAKNIVNLIENRYFPFRESKHFKTEEF